MLVKRMAERLLKGTRTEREMIRDGIYKGVACLTIMQNDDGTWHVDVEDVIIEGRSPVELLEELKQILVEA